VVRLPLPTPALPAEGSGARDRLPPRFALL